MYKQSINKIIAMVKMSDALDQAGYVEEAAGMMYNAFELAEDSAWTMAENLNNMIKTASKADREAKLAELENMTKTAKMVATATSWGEIGEWGAKHLINPIKNFIGKTPKKLPPGIAGPLEKGTGLLGDISKPGMGKFINRTPEGAISGLTNLGKAGLGTVGLVGAAGIGSALTSKDKSPGGTPMPSGTSGAAIPSAMAPTGAGTATMGGGMSGAAPAAMSAAAPQMAAIEQRIGSLENIVNAIRAKVGV